MDEKMKSISFDVLCIINAVVGLVPLVYAFEIGPEYSLMGVPYVLLPVSAIFVKRGGNDCKLAAFLLQFVSLLALVAFFYVMA